MNTKTVMACFVIAAMLIFAYSPLIEVIAANSELETATLVDAFLLAWFPLIYGVILVCFLGLVAYEVMQT